MKCKVNVSDLKDKKSIFRDEILSTNFDLYDLFLSIDDQNIKNTLHKSEEWFQKEIPLEAIDDMYKKELLNHLKKVKIQQLNLDYL